MAIEAIKEVEITANSSNVLELTDLNIGLKAANGNIFVLIDHYRSGYECPTCHGIGKMREITSCVCDNPENEFGPGVRNRFGAACEACMGDYLSKRVDKEVTCPNALCKDGHILHIPDKAKILPTTGIIMSVGPDVKYAEINNRVVFGGQSGTFLPMRGNTLVKALREHEIMGYVVAIDGAIPANILSDFYDYEHPLGRE